MKCKSNKLIYLFQHGFPKRKLFEDDFYNPVLVKEARLILSNGETPPLVQNKTNPQLVFQAWPGQGLNKELA